MRALRRTLPWLFALVWAALAGCQGWSAAAPLPAAASAPTLTLTPWRPAPPTAPWRPTPLPTPTLTPSPSPSPTPARTTFLFVGNIVPARCVRAAAEARGGDHYIYAQVAPLIRRADYAVALLNSSLTQRIPPTGCVPTFLLVGDPKHAATMAWAGFDAVNMATNHIKNGGDLAFLDTLAAVQEAGLPPLGAGPDLQAALRPLIVTRGGVRFALVALNEIEPRSFAGPQRPGAAPLTAENLEQVMAAARAQADVVIALPHWGPEYDSTPLYAQRAWARQWVAAGADVVVGNHSHVVQGIETLDGVLVFYSLGNFVFDQDWSLETQQGVMLQLTFEGPRLVDYRLFPVHTDGDGRVHQAPPAEAEAILQRIWAASALPATPTWEANP